MSSSAKPILDQALKMSEDDAPLLQNGCSPVLTPGPTKLSRRLGNRRYNAGCRNLIVVMSNACRGKR